MIFDNIFSLHRGIYSQANINAECGVSAALTKVANKIVLKGGLKK